MAPARKRVHGERYCPSSREAGFSVSKRPCHGHVGAKRHADDLNNALLAEPSQRANDSKGALLAERSRQADDSKNTPLAEQFWRTPLAGPLHQASLVEQPRLTLSVEQPWRTLLAKQPRRSPFTEQPQHTLSAKQSRHASSIWPAESRAGHSAYQSLLQTLKQDDSHLTDLTRPNPTGYELVVYQAPMYTAEASGMPPDSSQYEMQID